ncbi:MAG TPA: flagellum-specific ATP synthase FliI, partial [Paenibacillaceae bacterium]
FYTVLVDGDDLNEPVADAVRGILDGHIVLDRRLANKGHFPAIDVLASVSRLMKDIVSPEQMEAASRLKQLLAVYREAEDLIHIGAYQRGSNPDIDAAIEYIDRINAYTRQEIDEKVSFEEARRRLITEFRKG